MKIIVRAFVVVLALTGTAATTLTSSASTSTQPKIAVARTSMLPVPTCAPSDPNACGMKGR